MSDPDHSFADTLAVEDPEAGTRSDASTSDMESPVGVSSMPLAMIDRSALRMLGGWPTTTARSMALASRKKSSCLGHRP